MIKQKSDFRSIFAQSPWWRNVEASLSLEGINKEAIDCCFSEALEKLPREHWQKLIGLWDNLPSREELLSRNGKLGFNFKLNCPEIQIGNSEDLFSEESNNLSEIIRLLIPWRKGPYRIFGQQIDAEWNSNLKWDRLEPFFGSLDGKRILDIGCNNGYYMFRLLGYLTDSAQSPEFIIGIDPSEAFFFSYHLFQRYIQCPYMDYLLLGAEQLPYFQNYFDTVFCLGIVYHQSNPLQILQNIFKSMRSGGMVIVESMAIPGEEEVSLFPVQRYAKARNVYFIPTASCLVAWVCRAGFSEVKIVSTVKLTEAEQRKTELAPYESLSEFLDPNDRNKTIEGYPAPLRVMVVGTKY